jgi:hypothetical protein
MRSLKSRVFKEVMYVACSLLRYIHIKFKPGLVKRLVKASRIKFNMRRLGDAKYNLIAA